MSGKKRKKRSKTKRKAQPKSRGWALIVVDERPIRRAAVNKCKYIMKQLGTVAAELDAYDTEDLPAYRSWYHASFGRALTELRELHEEVHSREALINRIEHIRFWDHVSYYEASCRAERMEEHPEEEAWDDEDPWDDTYDEDEFEDDSPDDDPFHTSAEPTEEELWELFLDMARTLSGGAVFDESSDEFRAAFEAFKAESGFGSDNGGNGSGVRTDSESHARVKSLYRELAKQLHPDNLDADDAAAAGLWHRVQDAYARGDVEELEMLKARRNIGERRNFNDVPVGQILMVHRDCKEELRWLRQRHRSLRTTTSWRFTKLSAPELEQLRQTEDASLAHAIVYMRSRLEGLEERLEWYRRPPQTPRRPKKSSKVPEGQMTLF